MLTEVQKYAIIEGDAVGKSGRTIADETGVARATLGDFLRKDTYQGWWADYDSDPEGLEEIAEVMVQGELKYKAPKAHRTDSSGVLSIVTSKQVAEGVTHLMIPDTQCKPNIDMSYLEVLGEYIAAKQPEVIIHIGDHADMESLSSYDKGKASAEGKRVKEDISASIEGMNKLLKPLYELQKSQLKEFGEVRYKPKMVLTLGNHEQRIMRHVDANPELKGFLSYDDLRYEESGWEVYDFLKPVTINGVSYVHYMANPMTGKPYGGTALNVLKNVGESFCMGHKQCLDVATRFLPASGKQQWAIIAGAYYAHDESYKGHQGNHHWRGVVVQHRVKDGSFEPMFVSMEYLLDKYGNKGDDDE